MRFLLLAFLFTQSAFAQQGGGFLYATVTLKNDKSYTGQIRLDNESAAWDDLFEGYKKEPQIQQEIEAYDLPQIEEEPNEVFEFNFMKLWENKESQSSYTFKCQFGHISRIIEMNDRKSATVILKNGVKLKLRKRGSIIGSDIILFHETFGKIDFDWEDIQEIKFLSTPGNTNNALGQKIFGEVLTTDGRYEGFIVWDYNEEAFGKDIIDGFNQNVGYDLEFQQLASLTPDREGAIIRLKNNSEVFLKNSSDVNKENDGILVKNQKFGIIRIPWENLIRIDFISPTESNPGFENFQAPQSLTGTVRTSGGEAYNGKLYYDLDEAWDIEMLDGVAKGIRYYLPLYLIKKIVPLNYNFSRVVLSDNTELILGEEADVSRRNKGVLIWLSEEKTKYVPWNDVVEVDFTGS